MKRFNDVCDEWVMYGVEHTGLGMVQYAEKQMSCLRSKVKMVYSGSYEE